MKKHFRPSSSEDVEVIFPMKDSKEMEETFPMKDSKELKEMYPVKTSKEFDDSREIEEDFKAAASIKKTWSEFPHFPAENLDKKLEEENLDKKLEDEKENEISSEEETTMPGVVSNSTSVSTSIYVVMNTRPYRRKTTPMPTSTTTTTTTTTTISTLATTFKSRFKFPRKVTTTTSPTTTTTITTTTTPPTMTEQTTALPTTTTTELGKRNKIEFPNFSNFNDFDYEEELKRSTLMKDIETTFTPPTTKDIFDEKVFLQFGQYSVTPNDLESTKSIVDEDFNEVDFERSTSTSRFTDSNFETDFLKIPTTQEHENEEESTSLKSVKKKNKNKLFTTTVEPEHENSEVTTSLRKTKNELFTTTLVPNTEVSEKTTSLKSLQNKNKFFTTTREQESINFDEYDEDIMPSTSTKSTLEFPREMFDNEIEFTTEKYNSILPTMSSLEYTSGHELNNQVFGTKFPETTDFEERKTTQSMEFKNGKDTNGGMLGTKLPETIDFEELHEMKTTQSMEFKNGQDLKVEVFYK